MPVPRKKVSRVRRDNRRSHIHLKVYHTNKCPQCGEAKMPHRVCPHCGFYKGREILKQEEAKK
ncbi:MAG: 50S ribosomal protein L32 [Deltaproteobacteria bacterium]|nr:50S ribosomal protein L32 [Deltaproteobacteria bacterium]MBI2501021.1 50S ribosomal protein L32 [Deltaproteobacteria bacterium]MBI4197174.1 50S ribosomal protein L32 [Deltaproteobacteria bacterium]